MKAFLDFLMSIFGPKKKEIPAPNPTPKEVITEYNQENEEALKLPEIDPVQMKDDSPRLVTEYTELVFHNLPLKSLIEDLNIFVQREFKKQLIITMIFRTDEEQDYLYKDSAKYKKKKFKSPHQFHHAVDLRSRIFTASEIKQIEDYLNKKWNASNYYKWTAKAHTVGHGMHFHIQFVKQ